MITNQAPAKKKAVADKRPRSSSGQKNEAPKSLPPAVETTKRSGKRQNTNGSKNKIPERFDNIEQKEQLHTSRANQPPLSRPSSQSIAAATVERPRPSTSAVSISYGHDHLGSTRAPGPTSFDRTSNHAVQLGRQCTPIPGSLARTTLPSWPTGVQHGEQAHHFPPIPTDPEWQRYTAGHRQSSTSAHYRSSPETLRNSAVPQTYPSISPHGSSVNPPSWNVEYYESSDEYLTSTRTPSPAGPALSLAPPSSIGMVVPSGTFPGRRQSSAHGSSHSDDPMIASTEQGFSASREGTGPPLTHRSYGQHVGSPTWNSSVDSVGLATPTDTFLTLPITGLGVFEGCVPATVLAVPKDACYRSVGQPSSPYVAAPTPEYCNDDTFVPHRAPTSRIHDVGDMAPLSARMAHGVASDVSRLGFRHGHTHVLCLTTPSDDIPSGLLADGLPHGVNLMYDVASTSEVHDALASEDMFHASELQPAVGDTESSQMFERLSTALTQLVEAMFSGFEVCARGDQPPRAIARSRTLDMPVG
ncbi:hypothetical protein C8T65DRAFT_695682 [Cerioporus squamosus]|nr:hypothetical protein C8T65DRAFT_695682 [Cerioporus squamosus]